MKTFSLRIGEMKEVPDGEWVHVEVAEQLQENYFRTKELYEKYSRTVARMQAQLACVDERECSKETWDRVYDALEEGSE